MTKTKEPKVLQIIPAPPGMLSLYYSESGEAIASPIVCIALVENEQGDRWIEPRSFDWDEGVCNEGEGSIRNHLGFRLAQEPRILDQWQQEAREAAERDRAKAAK